MHFISVALLSLAAAAPASAFLSSPASLSRRDPGRSCSARGLGRLRAAASKQEADCLVIGGGISGLSTGLLVSKGASVLVADKSTGKPGGVIETRTEDGFIWEEGPNTFQPQDGTLSLAAEVGLADQVVATDPKLPRYVYKGGEVYKLPASGGPPDLSGIAGLLGPFGLVKTVIGALSPVSPSSKADETVIVNNIVTSSSSSSSFIPCCFS
jgi:oxygen-dependent protoporphyrinogen oxidase